ncbi:c-type cytochrome biogenesis protein CcmI [Pelagibius sp.]|uniref:c-type cytochrome biogenesis protein CcmI n=1 Tax=Pelagibius sp. TaxID=1931238 RepID=UPI00263326AB|nr:c-type cytochrome biogenesis protein CcmI [Pelagibius sp.]
MTLWIAIAIAVALTALWLTRPFLHRAQSESNEAEHAISIYRDQREEVQRDAESGLITAAERDAAEQEIESRALRAARLLDTGISVTRRAPLTAAGLGLLACAGAVGLYASMGAPDAVDQPLAERRTAILERQAASGDLESQAMLMIERGETEPESFEKWWTLARSHAAVGDYASAADAYRRAAELSDDDPAVLSAYAEALTLANGNKVPLAAKLIFSQAVQSGNDPRARYYLALAKAQSQDFEGALADWVQLLGESQAGAPWVPLVRRDIVNMTRFLKRDLAAVLPDATEAELARAALPVQQPVQTASASDPAQESARLAAALEADPKDWQGWIRLARLRAGAGSAEEAGAALTAAREHFAGAPFVLGKIDEVAAELGLAQRQVARGPSDEDVAAAASLSEEERDQMVRGMVDGLAARLEGRPDDLEGWLMLIRSYAVLQEAEAAQQAVRDASRAFEADAAKRRQIAQTADSLGIPPVQ